MLLSDGSKARKGEDIWCVFAQNHVVIHHIKQYMHGIHKTFQKTAQSAHHREYHFVWAWASVCAGCRLVQVIAMKRKETETVKISSCFGCYYYYVHIWSVSDSMLFLACVCRRSWLLYCQFLNHTENNETTKRWWWRRRQLRRCYAPLFCIAIWLFGT